MLVLNALYQPIGLTFPQKSIISLSDSSCQVIDVIYKQNPDGSLNTEELDYWRPVFLDEWLGLDIRPDIDNVIHSAKLSVRCPTVMVVSHDKPVFKRFRPTKAVLYEKQGGRCGYSLKKIPFHKGNIEHKIPKSYGGKETFGNLMFVDKDINAMRGNRPLEEVGLKPLFNHREPQPVPVATTLNFKNAHPDWKWFIVN